MTTLYIGALTLVLTLPAAALALVLARLLDGLAAGRQATRLWRAARLAALSPIAFAIALPLIGALRPAASQTGPGIAESGNAALAAAPVFDLPVFLLEAASEGGAHFALALWIVAALYLAGLTLALVRLVRRRAVVMRLLAESGAAGPALLELAARCEETAGLAPASAEVRLVDTAVTPFVAGFKPVVVMPRTLAAGAAARFALIHEFTHVRRGDEADRLLGEILASVLWFNPFLCAIEARLAGARELACDAQALERLAPQERRGYGEALALAARLTCKAPQSSAVTAFFGTPKGLQARRLKAILGHGPKPRPAATLAGALALIGLTAMPVAASQHIAAQWSGAIALSSVQAEPRTLSAPVGEAVMEAQEQLAGNDPDGALVILDQVLAGPELTAYELSVVQRLRGQAYFVMERYEDAIAGFEAALQSGALELGDANTLRVNIGQLMFVEGDIDAGIARIEQAIDAGLEPSAHLSKLLAQAYAQKERWEDGLVWLERYLDQAETIARGDLSLAEAYYQALGRSEEAAEMRARREAMAETP